MITKVDKKHIKRLARQGKSIAETVRQQESSFWGGAENVALLYNCANDWNAMHDIRETRRRNLRYKNGNQWGDIIQDPDTGKDVREDAYISKTGKVPLKHNFIQQFIRNIHGQLLSNPTQTVVHARSSDENDLGDMLTNTIQANHQLNDAVTLNINMLEELLLGGIGMGKIGYQFWSEKNRYDATINQVNPNRIFFNQDFEDPRMTDVRRIGEIHDYTFDDLVRNFAKNETDVATLQSVYIKWNADRIEGMSRSKENLERIDFHGLATVDNKYRVIEVWEKKGRWVLYCHDYLDGTEEIHHDLTMQQINEINRERKALAAASGIPEEDVRLIHAEKQFEYFWSVKFLTPTGLCIKEMETPYTHESHPYVLTCMPIMDGHITPVISDLIDLQRYINRLIVMIDFIMGASAKGALMVPEECIPEGWSLQDFNREYVKTNGVMLIAKNAADKLPKQLSSNATNIGAWEMLKLQMDIMQQISGLSGAVQGQVAKSGTPASLYAQQAQNSMLNYLVVFDRFNSYCKSRDEKLLKVIMQYYNERRYVDISGKAFNEVAKYYEPQMAKKVVDFNLTTSQATNTPIFKQIADDMLMEMLRSNMIPLEVYLNNASMPFAEKLKNDIKQFNENAAQGNLDPSQMANLQNQAGLNADPAAMAMMEKFVGGDEPMISNGMPMID